MSQEEKKEIFTPDHGFRIMENWPVIVRWILVLPVALLSFLIANGFSNIATKITEALWFTYAASFLFHTIATGLFIYCGAATAPNNRKAVMAILSGIMILGAVVIFTIPQENYEAIDLSLTLKIINAASVVLGIIMVYNVWTKPLVREQVEM